MTCIIGIKHKGKVYIGGDSAGSTSNYDVTIRLDPKVFIVDGVMALGYTTSFRMGQLLRYMILPKHPDGLDEFKYMVTEVIPLIRKTFSDGGYNKKKDEVDEGGTFLVGYRGHLYEIESDYQVGEAADGYTACGCGYAYALGNLFHTKSLSPEKRIIKALEAATHYSGAVAPPFINVKV